MDNVTFLKNRIDNYWGGFNSIIATMQLMKAALSDERHFNRLVFLQGKDYPLQSPSYIHSFFDKRRGEEFCKGYNLSISKNAADQMKIRGFWLMDGRRTLFKKIVNKTNAILKIGLRKKRFECQDDIWDIYQGWAQFALTSDCARYILQVYETNVAFNRYMKHRFPPDELYIPTIIRNSSFSKNISDYSLTPRKGAQWSSPYLNLTYFEYPIVVDFFDKKQDYEELKKTGALFFRKVRLPEGKELLDEIDYHIKQEK